MSWRTTTDHSSAIPVGQLALRSPLLPSLPSLLPALLPALPSLPSVLFASSALLRTNAPSTQSPFSPFMKSSRMSERMPSSMISSFSLRYRWYSPGEWRYEWNETWWSAASITTEMTTNARKSSPTV